MKSSAERSRFRFADLFVSLFIFSALLVVMYFVFSGFGLMHESKRLSLRPDHLSTDHNSALSDREAFSALMSRLERIEQQIAHNAKIALGNLPYVPSELPNDANSPHLETSQPENSGQFGDVGVSTKPEQEWRKAIAWYCGTTDDPCSIRDKNSRSEGKVIARAPRGSRIPVSGCSRNAKGQFWCRAELGEGIVGYVSGEILFLKLTETSKPE